MKTNKKLFAGALGIVLSLAVAADTAMSAQAAESGSRMNFFNGGIGMLLEPSCMDAAEKIDEMAEELNVSTDTEDKTETSLVMANIKGQMNVRSDASIDSDIIGYLYKDCGGEILERRDGWTKLRSGNMIGWACDDYLVFGEEAEALADSVGKLIATVNVETLRVREKAEENAEVYGLLPEGEVMDVVGEDTESDWICVNYEGKDGYVAAEYVTLTFRIDAGETLEEVKVREAAEKEAKRYVNYGEFTADADTLLLLAALIQCEAGGEPYEGQVAVGAVVMNRVRSSAYPNTVHGVIYASGQFTPAMSGKLNKVYEAGKIYDSCIRAAEEALSGVSNVGDLTHFRRNNGREGLVINNHVFY